MFTGIIEEVGHIKSIKQGGHFACLEIAADKILDGLKLGDSVAVCGVCLTATKVGAKSFFADVMPETMNRSNLGRLGVNSPVNLERAATLNSRLGGHIVSGHIDALAKISAIRRDEIAVWYTLLPPPELLKYIIEKGSVTLDGVSLTIAEVNESGFSVSLIPHTAANTTFDSRRVGDMINLECDIIGKYVEKLLTNNQADSQDDKTNGITAEFLARCGF